MRLTCGVDGGGGGRLLVPLPVFGLMPSFLFLLLFPFYVYKLIIKIIYQAVMISERRKK